jgi:UDP-glucose 4-epimerase
MDKDLSKSILITGGCGYLGRHLISSLSKYSSNRITVIDINKIDESLNSAHSYIQADIRNSNEVEKIIDNFKPDVVVHLAALKSVEESFAHPSLYAEVNTIATKNLATICASKGVERFLFASSAAVYGNIEAELVTEDLSCNPISPYGESKLLAENELLSIKSETMFIGILRIFNLFGYTNNLKPTARELQAGDVQSSLYRAIMNREAFCLNGNDYSTYDGTAIRDYIHPLDVANAIALLLKADIEKEILNLGCGMGTSLGEIINAINGQVKPPIDVVIHPRRSGDIAKIVSNSNRAQHILNWRISYSDIETLTSHLTTIS